MSDFVNVKVAPKTRVRHQPDPKARPVVHTAASGIVKMRADDFATFGPDGLGLVHRATKEDREAPEAVVSAEFTPKHKGGGRWIVVDKTESLVSGDEVLESKAAAEAWIERRLAGDENPVT